MPTKKVTREELANYRTLPFGKKHGVRLLIESLKPGEVCIISREDLAWKRTTPGRFCNEISKATRAKFRIEKIAGKVGWVVERIS